MLTTVLYTAHVVNPTEVYGLNVCAATLLSKISSMKGSSIAFRKIVIVHFCSLQIISGIEEGNSILVFLTVAEMTVLNLIVIFSIGCK